MQIIIAVASHPPILAFDNIVVRSLVWCPAVKVNAVLIGVRTFCPRPVAKVIMDVGGTGAMLGLIAMATDVEGLYAAVKALVCVVKSSHLASRDMDRTKGYQARLLDYSCNHVKNMMK